MTKRSIFTIFLVILVVFLLDQWSKGLIVSQLTPLQIVPVFAPIFNLTLTLNPGVAFGFLATLPDGQREIALALTTIVALGVVLYLLIKDYRNDLVAQVALAMIVGGALGNITDRFRIGFVVDFLDFHWGDYHWPAFNLADSAICVGVTFLLFYGIFSKKKS